MKFKAKLFKIIFIANLLFLYLKFSLPKRGDNSVSRVSQGGRRHWTFNYTGTKSKPYI